MEKLVIKGIYTEQEEMIDIVLEETEILYFIIEIEKEFFKKQDVEEFLKKNLTDNNIVKFCHIKKEKLHPYIDGYLGKLQPSLYNIASQILKEKTWYDFYVNDK